MIRLLFLTTYLSAILISSAHAKSSTLRVAVSANFAPALQKISPEFTQQTGISIEPIVAATGTLFIQLLNGAPYDVFLSADSKRPQLLVEKGIATPGSLHGYTIGQLAYWSTTLKNNQKINWIQQLQDISNSPTKKFAIANPNIAPYGLAAQQALKQAMLWPSLKHKLVMGINVNQTFQQTRSGAVAGGIVAQSQLVANNHSGVIIPPHYYQPLIQQLVIINTSKKQQQANLLVNYLRSNKVQTQLQLLGYLAINSPNLDSKEQN